MLSNWTLEIKKCEKEENEILGTLASSITSRKVVDEMLIAIAPKKQPKHTISMPPPTVEEGKVLRWSVSMDRPESNKKVGRIVQ